jgi:hypothetical protein
MAFMNNCVRENSVSPSILTSTNQVVQLQGRINEFSENAHKINNNNINNNINNNNNNNNNNNLSPNPKIDLKTFDFMKDNDIYDKNNNIYNSLPLSSPPLLPPPPPPPPPPSFSKDNNVNNNNMYNKCQNDFQGCYV